jgi:hypothetical protein
MAVRLSYFSVARSERVSNGSVSWADSSKNCANNARHPNTLKIRRLQFIAERHIPRLPSFAAAPHKE